jgi:hypothetical protein
MMSSRKFRAIAMVGALAAIAPLKAAGAQDTTTVRDTLSTQQARSDTTGQDSAGAGYATDTTSAVQNPPGYRGMERDTTMFPPQDDTTSADATSRTSQRSRQDSLGEGADQNPPGYRGMERPAGLDSAAQGGDTSSAKKSTTKKHGKATTKKHGNRNPSGHRGMERDTSLSTPDSSAVPGETGSTQPR